MTETRFLTRGDHTREALIRAALEVFGHSGFDAASTRAIAQAAGVNQALIGYHFGGKRGLYLGVFEHIIEQMRWHMAPVVEEVMQRLETIPRKKRDRRELALQLSIIIFDNFNDMIAEHAAEGWVRLILREQQDPTEAFQMLYDSVFSRMLALVTSLVAMATGLEETSEACRIRVLMILGQVLVFHTARGTTSLFMAWGALTPDNMAALKKQFRLVLEAQFGHGVPAS